LRPTTACNNKHTDAPAYAVLTALLDLRLKAASPAAAAFVTAYSDTGLLGVTGAAAPSEVSALVHALVKVLKEAASGSAQSSELKAAVAAAKLTALTSGGSSPLSALAVLASGTLAIHLEHSEVASVGVAWLSAQSLCVLYMY
jgi:hypothetical protein